MTPDTSFLASEVSNLKEGHGELRREFRDLNGKVDAGFTLLAAKLDKKTETNWQPIGIVLSFLTASGIAIAGALYYPMRESMQKHEVSIESIRAVMVPRVEHEKMWRDEVDRERLVDDRIKRLFEAERKLAIDGAYLQGQMHPLPPR